MGIERVLSFTFNAVAGGGEHKEVPTGVAQLSLSVSVCVCVCVCVRT